MLAAISYATGYARYVRYVPGYGDFSRDRAEAAGRGVRCITKLGDRLADTAAGLIRNIARTVNGM